MKNALIAVLLIVAAALGILLYKGKAVSKVEVAHNKLPDHNGNNVDTVGCPLRTGQNKKTCVIPISYLTDMVNGWVNDYAIELRHNDTVKWVGDNGESIEVPEMTGVLCSDHHKPDPPPGNRSLISNISATGNVVTAQVTGTQNYCYKNTIKVTVNGKTTPIDPHYFGSGS